MGSFIFTAEEMKRIQKRMEKQEIVTVDLHGMKCADAKRVVKNIIALHQGAFLLELIHGYNGGTSLKRMILSGMFSSRVKERISHPGNYGLTTLVVG